MSIKLNKTQISVLAEEIYKELEKEANKYKESEEYINFESTLKNDTKYKKLKKVKSTLEELLADIELKGVYDVYYANQCMKSLDSYVKQLRDKKFPSAILPTKTSIENKIILKTIDSVNVDELIASVKESFKLV